MEKLTDNQIKEILKLRLKNLGFSATITEIVIVHKQIKEFMGVRYIIKTKEWADEAGTMLFNMFYINEYELLNQYKMI